MSHLTLIETHQHFDCLVCTHHSDTQVLECCGCILRQLEVCTCLRFGDVFGQILLETVLTHMLNIVCRSPEHCKLWVVRYYKLIFLVAPDVQAADVLVVQLFTVLGNCEWETIIFAFARVFPKLPLKQRFELHLPCICICSTTFRRYVATG